MHACADLTKKPKSDAPPANSPCALVLGRYHSSKLVHCCYFSVLCYFEPLTTPHPYSFCMQRNRLESSRHPLLRWGHSSRMRTRCCSRPAGVEHSHRGAAWRVTYQPWSRSSGLWCAAGRMEDAAVRQRQLRSSTHRARFVPLDNMVPAMPW